MTCERAGNKEAIIQGINSDKMCKCSNNPKKQLPLTLKGANNDFH